MGLAALQAGDNNRARKERILHQTTLEALTSLVAHKDFDVSDAADKAKKELKNR